MAEKEPSNSGAFDLARIRELVEMMEKHGLTEVSLQHGDERWRLQRGVPGGFSPAYAPPMPVPAYAPPPAPIPAASAEPPQHVADGTVTINSPTVGTFYSSPTPDDPPFVTPGSKVSPETVVCIVEAMKVFNQIPSEVSGTVTEMLVKNGDSVEFGQPLFRVRPG